MSVDAFGVTHGVVVPSCVGEGAAGGGEVFWWLTGDYSQAPDPQSAHSNLPLKCSASSRAGICTGAGTAGGCRNEGR